MPFTLIAPLFLLVVLQLCIPHAHGRDEFRKQIPNGLAANRPGSGITCEFLGHENCGFGAPINAFGKAFQQAEFKWTTGLCQADSDGDGLTNGEELGDPCCKWSIGDTPQRLSMLSDPGDANSVNEAEKCITGTPKPSVVPSPIASSGPEPSQAVVDDDVAASPDAGVDPLVPGASPAVDDPIVGAASPEAMADPVRADLLKAWRL